MTTTTHLCQANTGMQPYYFGAPDRQLFGSYHPPGSGSGGRFGVVLCYPVLREQVRAHRTYRQLALRLARAGFPVLRFDYFGSGDSPGDTEGATMPRWMEDVSAAIDEMKRRSSLSKVALVGLRVGATLALLAGNGRTDVDAMVLWNPVINGKTYMEELRALDLGHFGRLREQQPRGLEHETRDELLGFPLTDALRTGMEGIDLLGSQPSLPKRLLLLDSGDDSTGEELGRYLASLSLDHECRRVPDAVTWLDGANSLVPVKVIQSMILWISEAAL